MNKFDHAYNTCPICNGGVSFYHQDFRKNTIFKCSSCSVQFMNPVYSDEYLNDYYGRYYEEGFGDAHTLDVQLSQNKEKFRFIDDIYDGPGRVLDYGCGNGNFAAFAKKKGWQVDAYDVDCGTMNSVKDQFGVEGKCGNINDIDWSNNTYDLIHANHVIEHLKHPVKDLILLRDLLTDRGYIYISVPNIKASSARMKYFMEKIGLKRRNIGKYYDSEHHIFYYSPKSMKNILEQCGYEVCMCKNAAKGYTGNSFLKRSLMYGLLSIIYSSSGFFVIARKKLTK